MFVLNKKKICIFLLSFILLVVVCEIIPKTNTAVLDTVALPVNNKVIILDAGHGR